MPDLRFEHRLDQPPGFLADAVLDNSVFEVVSAPRDLRRFRSAIVEIARVASADARRHGILVLDEPQISDERICQEWDGIQNLFRPDILARISLVIHRNGAAGPVFGPLSGIERENITTVVENVRQHSVRPVRRPSEAFFDILRILLIHWFRKAGPRTSKELSEHAGVSYPTMADALERLEPHLLRHSDRRVELRSFPRDAWLQLVAQSEKVRASQGYSDRSGRPRPIEVLRERLRELNRDDVAVAGVLGARHYLPSLDLAGTPRLDLIIHGKAFAEPQSLLRKLDPALKPVNRGESAHVVLHTLFRPASFFTDANDGLRWADQVECLLDLHELRLEPQALAFLNRLTTAT